MCYEVLVLVCSKEDQVKPESIQDARTTEQLAMEQVNNVLEVQAVIPFDLVFTPKFFNATE